ncbi:MAG: thiamine pyrophosphate-dependent enzyme, partial [Victivallaceae bacterium]|nr:thiamine pyrophosphate-dependent enzyme [Victivallaceae bacterium]
GSSGKPGCECKNCAGFACNGGDKPYPNFVGIAAGYEIPGRAVWKDSELEEAVREMLETPGPFLLDVYTGYEEHVLPMIPPGADYHSVIER